MRNGRHGDQDAVDLPSNHQTREVDRRTYRDTVDLASVKRWLIIDESHNFELRSGDQETREPHPGFSSSVDCDALASTHGRKTEVLDDSPAASDQKYDKRAKYR